jgi:hypothetical protein
VSGGYDALDARMAREKQDDINRKHGQFLLAVADDARERWERGEDPFLEALLRAHQAKASEATDQQ